MEKRRQFFHVQNHGLLRIRRPEISALLVVLEKAFSFKRFANAEKILPEIVEFTHAAGIAKRVDIQTAQVPQERVEAE